MERKKLFGWWGGYGLDGTSAWLESMGLRPGRPWAVLAGGSEFGGGVLSLPGLLNPLGPLGVIGAMATAARKAHWGKPIWVTEGGPELPVTNISIATALMLAGPGKYSLDRALGIRLPRWIILIGLVVIYTMVSRIPRAVVSPPPEVGTNRHGRFGGKYVMDPQWLRWVKRLQAIARDGLTCAADDYDVGRYEQLREIAAEILASRSTGELEDARALLELETAPPPPR